MCWIWPDEDPKYDKYKSRADNYQNFRRIFKTFVDSFGDAGGIRSYHEMFTKRIFKGAHLDWNYTEKLSDLIKQGVVKVPITDFDIVFVEWSAGNLDEVELGYKKDKALINWGGENPEYNKIRSTKGYTNLFWEKRSEAYEAHQYNDSNHEEYNPVILLPAPSPVSDVQYGNYADAIFIPLQEREHTAFWITGIAE